MKTSKTTLIFALSGEYLNEKEQYVSYSSFCAWFLNHPSIKLLLSKLDYQFTNKSLLIEAFCHPSFINENALLNLKSYQRLEFLGDSFLSLFISSMLIENDEDDEGDLSKKRAALVNKTYLSNLSKTIDLSKNVLVGRGIVFNDEYSDSIACDVFESLLGAIFLDSDFEKCSTVCHKIINRQIINIDPILFDYKTQLQEWSLKYNGSFPKYVHHENTDSSFDVDLFIDQKNILSTNGLSKKKAEEKAAQIFFNNLNLNKSGEKNVN